MLLYQGAAVVKVKLPNSVGLFLLWAVMHARTVQGKLRTSCITLHISM